MLGLIQKNPCRNNSAAICSRVNKVGAQILDPYWHRAAGLTDVQQKQSSLCVACGTNPRCVQQSPVVIAHQAHRDHSGSRRQLIDQVIRRDKPIVRRNGPQPYAVQREFALRGDDLVARPPLQTVRPSGSAGACSRSDSDFLGFSLDRPRQRATDSN